MSEVRRRFPWGKAFAILGAVITLLAITIPLTLDAMYWGRLNSRIQAVKAAGEPIDPEDFRKDPIADSENRCTLLVPLLENIRLTKEESAALDPIMSGFIATDEEMQAARKVVLKWVEEDTLREGLTRPKVKWPRILPGSVDDNEPLLTMVRELANLLAADARIQIRTGNNDAAIARLEQLSMLADTVREDATLIGWLVGVGIDALGADIVTSEPGLKPTRENARRLIDRYLETKRRTIQTQAMWRVERSRCVTTLKTMGAGAGFGKATIMQIMGNSSAAYVIDSFSMSSKALIEEDPVERNRLIQQIKSMTPGLTQTFGSLLTGSSERTIEVKPRRQQDLSLAATVLALRAYESDHGRLPESLDVLVPEYLPFVPEDVISAKREKLRYDPARQFVWGCNVDGVDDGGQIDPPPRPAWSSPETDGWKAKDRGVRVHPPLSRRGLRKKTRLPSCEETGSALYWNHGKPIVSSVRLVVNTGTRCRRGMYAKADCDICRYSTAFGHDAADHAADSRGGEIVHHRI